MIRSVVKEIGEVTFPKFANERVYMLPFTKQHGLPNNLKHWQSTVDAMLKNIDTTDFIYLMIDQKQVNANEYHRRPGLHIDGYWIPEMNRHGGGHSIQMGVEKSEAIILASNVQACRAFDGNYSADISENGACENVDLRHTIEVTMMPNKAYIGNVSMLHESLPVDIDCERTVVRLNVANYNVN